ncbi:MAG: choice-of-anchor V domain-containing protein [Blastocatellia bacterium]|nr:choice-of-anchor V domain-containing protein [Blastocatellia bacterium]
MRKRNYKLIVVAIFLAVGLRGSRVSAFVGGPPNGVTGAPGEATCAVSGCHGNNEVNVGSGVFAITGLPAAGYAPNQEVDLTLTLTQASRSLYGFPLTAVDAGGKQAGELILIEPSRTQKNSENAVGSVREYVSHTFQGVTPTLPNGNSWKVRWKSPAQSVGMVTFYAAGNAANGNGNSGGDFIYTTSAALGPQTAPTALSTVSAASFAAQGALAPETIAAAFGIGLAPSTLIAFSTPLPIQLGGTQVIVRDALGVERTAPLFFASPTQVNYLIPAGTGAGTATATVRRDGFATAQGAIQIEPVAPALFSANANGRGVAAAVLFRRKANGQESFEPLAEYGATTQQFEPLPIDLGASGDVVALILFGTGFRAAQSSQVGCAIGGAPAQVLFSGAQGALAGLDQANILLPTSLAGRGLVDVVLTAAGRPANTVQVRIK